MSSITHPHGCVDAGHDLYSQTSTNILDEELHLKDGRLARKRECDCVKRLMCDGDISAQNTDETT